MTAAESTPERIIAALTTFPEELTRLLADQPREALLAPASDGGLGVVELLPHLRDWEEIFLGRVDAMLTGDHPTLPAFDDELWAIERDYRGQDPDAVLRAFLGLRADLVEHLAHADEDSWHRTADHETYGEVNLLWLGSQIVASDTDHGTRIREALG